MITGIRVSSAEMVIHKDDGKKTTLPKFTKNQTHKAKILKLLPEGKAQILISGQKVVVKTALRLMPGEEVRLKVLSEKDTVVLKLMDPVQKMTTGQISSLVSLFSKDGIMTDIAGEKIAWVKTLLQDMALKSDTPDPGFLPKLIDRGGLTWERKIARILMDAPASPKIKAALDSLQQQDIKGNLLKEIFLAGPGKSGPLTLAASFLETMENFQLLNHNSSDSGRFLLPFPVFTGPAFSFGQLLIDTGGKSKSDGRDADRLIQISFLLEMTQLGMMRADFSILKKEISGRFLLRDEPTRSYVESMIPELKKGLARIQYQVRQIDCSIAPKEDIQPSRFVETLVKAQEDQVVNIVI